MILNEIMIEGFGSIVDRTNFEFNKGINILTGANGSGKTTLLNAIFWALFGDTSKGLVAKQIPSKVKDKNFNGTFVVLSFTGNDGHLYDVVRSINYKLPLFGLTLGTGLLIFKNETLIDAQHVKDSQQELENIIGINKRLFLNSVFFGQKTLKFLQYSSTERKQIFEEIFDISYVDAALENSKLVLSELNDDLLSLVNSENKLKVKIENIDKLIEKEKEIEKSFDTNKKEKIKLLKNNLNILQESYDKVEEVIVPDKSSLDFYFGLKEEHKKSKKRYEQRKQEIEWDIKNLNSKIEDIKPIKETCNTCGQLLKDINKAKEDRQKKIEELKTSIETLKVDLSELVEPVEFVEDKKIEFQATQIKALEIKKQESEDLKKRYTSDINKTKKSIEELKNSKFDKSSLHEYLDDLEKKNALLLSAQKNIESTEKDIEIYKYWSSIGFTTKGFKAYLLDMYLKAFNDVMNIYSDLLGVTIKFYIDDSKTTKPLEAEVNNGDLDLSYSEFSGGEAARVDIAICFALNDLIAENISIITMDEVFEGLDDNGIEQAFSLLRIKPEKQIYVTSHKDYIDGSMANFITVNKQDGRTSYS